MNDRIPTPSPQTGVAAKTVVLTFDDACKSHLYNVAPILKKYGFRATFFICRFSRDWMEQYSGNLLTGDEIKKLHDQGFEIGNHTWTHRDLKRLTLAECEDDITKMYEFLKEIDIVPRCFAYPGGPVAEQVIPMLRDRFGFKLARSVGSGVWSKATDPFRVPCCALQHDDASAFYSALSNCADGNAQVLLFHGVPDPVHEHVTTSVEFFAQCMKHLFLNHYRVIGMEEYFDLLQA